VVHNHAHKRSCRPLADVADIADILLTLLTKRTARQVVHNHAHKRSCAPETASLLLVKTGKKELIGVR